MALGNGIGKWQPVRSNLDSDINCERGNACLGTLRMQTRGASVSGGCPVGGGGRPCYVLSKGARRKKNAEIGTRVG